MNELDFYIQKLSKFTSDYTYTKHLNQYDHINKWIHQFDSIFHVQILKEVCYTLQQSYISKEDLHVWCYKIISQKTKDFWENINFLDIQMQGNSQKNILSIINYYLHELYNIDIRQCGKNSKRFIYFDDIIFSGSRVIKDINNWIENHAPDQCHIDIITLYSYQYGMYVCKKNLSDKIFDREKLVSIMFYTTHILENRVRYANTVTPDVYWPKMINEEIVLNYIDNCQTNYKFIPRTCDNQSKYFSCEENRYIIERELLLAGIKIINFCKTPSLIMKPLGFSYFGIGFGSTIVTYRNCPNNCPLAFWWGDENASIDHPFKKWYPLFPRKTYEQSA